MPLRAPKSCACGDGGTARRGETRHRGVRRDIVSGGYVGDEGGSSRSRTAAEHSILGRFLERSGPNGNIERDVVTIQIYRQILRTFNHLIELRIS